MNFWKKRPVLELVLQNFTPSQIECPFHLLDLYEMGYGSPVNRPVLSVEGIRIKECLLGITADTIMHNGTEDFIIFTYKVDSLRLNMGLNNMVYVRTCIYNKVLHLLNDLLPFHDNNVHQYAIDYFKETLCVHITPSMIDMSKFDVCRVFTCMNTLFDYFDQFAFTPHVTTRIIFQYDSTHGFFQEPLSLIKPAYQDENSHHCED
jgi:hypothetical protein